jgi:hypothetical protein
MELDSSDGNRESDVMIEFTYRQWEEFPHYCKEYDERRLTDKGWTTALLQ